MNATAAPELKIPPAIAALKVRLDDGGHTSPHDGACIMEVVSMLAGESWSDHPACTSPVIGAFCRAFWDRTPRSWQGLLDRVDRIAGSASTKDVDKARGYLAADWAVRRFAPRWLRAIKLDEDAARLEGLPPVVDEKTAKAARDAAKGLRELAWKRYDEALDRIRKAAWAAGAAEAAGAAWAAGAAEAAEAAGAAGAARAAWAAWAAGAAEAAWAARAAEAAEAAEAAGAAGAAWAARAAEAAEAAWAAWAAEIDWSKVKGKSFTEQKAYFRALIRPHIEKVLGQTIEESIDEGLALLDAMLALTPEAVPA